MPVDRSRYPADWEAISASIRFERAGGRCEGSPAYPDCRAEHGQPHPVIGARVVLTVGHLNHDPRDNDPANLRAWCQRCHNRYDADFRRRNRAQRRRAQQLEAGQMEMEGMPTLSELREQETRNRRALLMVYHHEQGFEPLDGLAPGELERLIEGGHVEPVPDMPGHYELTRRGRAVVEDVIGSEVDTEY